MNKTVLTKKTVRIAKKKGFTWGIVSLLLVLCLGGCSLSGELSNSSKSNQASSTSSATSAQEANTLVSGESYDAQGDNEVVYECTSPVQSAEVVSIVDGDTLKVKVDGQNYKLRLIGCDCPESVAPDKSRNCEEGKIASDYTKSLVQKGQTVYLTQDVSDTDKYGRLLRYVWLEKPGEEVTKKQACQTMLNAILINQGYAQAKAYKPDVTCKSFFSELEDEAVCEGRGVSYKWA